MTPYYDDGNGNDNPLSRPFLPSGIIPYYLDERAGIAIIHGDCRDVLPTLETGSVDLVIADPPYNAGINYGDGVNDARDWDEYGVWLTEHIAEMERVSAGAVLVFGSITSMFAVVRRMQPRWVCAWTKPMSLSHRVGGSPFLPHWEPCMVFGRLWGDGGRVPSFSLSDVWSENPSKRNGHPCPKPEALIRRVMAKFPGESVLDPFMGSGTTLRAAKDLGRRAIGIEISEEYCRIAVERLQQGVLPL